ncbi:cysteine-rich KTR domain-containing protein [Clostridioides difficile]|nr:hypothetical protein [Clostridioides difficile]EGT4613985.1 hypothetical protein [Clostridioides difficile]EGT4729738.1 hypothetical protein [Clostridioides difficile]EGT4780879.1 hypothetical protein [Clostridioides difficile]EGT5364209.1 hypothetical protein [Clostridioides difficile]
MIIFCPECKHNFLISAEELKMNIVISHKY